MFVRASMNKECLSVRLLPFSQTLLNNNIVNNKTITALFDRRMTNYVTDLHLLERGGGTLSLKRQLSKRVSEQMVSSVRKRARAARPALGHRPIPFAAAPSFQETFFTVVVRDQKKTIHSCIGNNIS